MEKDFSLEPVKTQMLAEVKELSDCNEFSVKYGLVLSDNQIQNLVQKRFETLRDSGRIEFGAGILKKLVYAFCDSPYIHNLNYEETILELQDAFYYFKNESDDRISDDELIEHMKDTFDGKAQGSIEYLTGTSLEELCRSAHNSFTEIEDVDDGNGNMD